MKLWGKCLFVLIILNTGHWTLNTPSAVLANTPDQLFQRAGADSWPWIDAAFPNQYNNAPTAMVVDYGPDAGKWQIWNCAHTATGRGHDSIWHLRLNTAGAPELGPQEEISPTDTNTFNDGKHNCAPTVFTHSTSLIKNGQRLYKMYYECAIKFYDIFNPDDYEAEGFAQICHAASVDGVNWQKYDENYWILNGDYAPLTANPTPVIRAGPGVLQRCAYTYQNGKHLIIPNCLDDVANYGSGHPTALVFKDAAGGEKIWLYYYYSDGSPYPPVYLAKSDDGFHFEAPIKVNGFPNPSDQLPTPEITFLDIPGVGQYNGVFINVSVYNGINYMSYSLDGINWYFRLTNQYRIGQTSESFPNQTYRCGQNGQPAFLADKYKHLVMNPYAQLFSAEGFLSTADGGRQFGCYSSQEDLARGSTWKIYHLWGTLQTNLLSAPPIYEDINSDGKVDILDLARIVNARTSATINPYTGPEDVTGDSILDIADLNNFLSQYSHL